MMFTTFFNMVAEHLSQGAMMLQQAGWTKIFPWSMMVFMSVREVCASSLQNLQQMAEQTVAASSGALDALSSGRWQQELFLFAVLVFMSSILAGMAWSFLREIATEEREIETVAHEEFMPDVYIAKSICLHSRADRSKEKEVYPDDWMWFLDESPLQCSSYTLCRARYSRRLVVDDQECESKGSKKQYRDIAR